MEKQKTIQKDFSLEGIGLQTGKPVKIGFYPEDENKGISFSRIDIKNSKTIVLSDELEFKSDRRSRIGSGNVYVETVEHVVASLYGAGVCNVRIEMNSSEPPSLDGSAIDFLKALKKAGIRTQGKEKKIITITEPIWVEDKEAFLGIFPSENFKITYLLEYKSDSIGKQLFSKVITEETFEKEIAPARTFCLEEEAEVLKKLGYGKGANYTNTLVMKDAGPVENVLRFPNEPVSHKVLDLIGDLYLLGIPVKGRVMATRSGHRLNQELVKKIKENV